MTESAARDEHPVDAVVRHPRVASLGRDQDEQGRVDAFARDLARWLYGFPADDLGPLARVVTIVARRELADARWLCRDRPLLSVEAAARATEALWPWLRGDLEPPEKQEGEEGTAPAPKADRAVAGEEAGETGGTEVDDLLQALRQLANEGGEDDIAARVGEDVDLGDDVAKAAQAASEGAFETDKLARTVEMLAPGIGWSTSPAHLERALLEPLEGLTALLEKLPQLRKLADHLGRMEEASRRKGPGVGGREEVVGVHLGGDAATALPSELALLGDPETEDLFYDRYLERRLVSLELTGRGDEGIASGERRGPVIACIDTSSSMGGAPEMAAKALVLALCRQVIPRGRLVHLILFGGLGERTEIRLMRGRGGLEGLLAFLRHSFRSGTDFDGPLVRAMELLEEQDLQTADVLVVTDGLGEADAQVIERIKAAKAARGVRVWSVVLGRSRTAGVDPFSDEVWVLDPGDAATAVGLVRRIG
jgi:uncharacterized protein with von Willebrand factor type A (vWA) domain